MGQREKNQASYGTTWITDGEAVTGNWFRLYAVSTCEFLSLVDASRTWTVTISDFVLKEGCSIDGHFTAVELVTGTMICYKDRNY